MNQSDPAKIKDLLNYDPETGKLYWKDRPDDSFASRRAASIFRAKSVGKEAFTATTKNGYRFGRIYDKGYLAHRVIWAIVHGEWPEKDVDHINRDRSDNRLSNLRAATRSQNNINRSLSPSCGVRQRGRRWAARIVVDGQEKRLGQFGCETAAKIARRVAELSTFGEFARGAKC